MKCDEWDQNNELNKYANCSSRATQKYSRLRDKERRPAPRVKEGRGLTVDRPKGHGAENTKSLSNTVLTSSYFTSDIFY